MMPCGIPSAWEETGTKLINLSIRLYLVPDFLAKRVNKEAVKGEKALQLLAESTASSSRKPCSNSELHPPVGQRTYYPNREENDQKDE